MAYPKDVTVANKAGTQLEVVTGATPLDVNVVPLAEADIITVSNDSFSAGGAATMATGLAAGTYEILNVTVATLTARKLKIALDTNGGGAVFYTTYCIGGTSFSKDILAVLTFGGGARNLQITVTDLTGGGAIDISASISYRTA